MRKLIGRMTDHEPWWAEWWSAAAAVGWSLYVLFLTDGLGTFSGFDKMLKLAPAWVWYIFSLGFPIGQFWALRRDERRARWWLCFAMAWWWGFVAYGVTADGLPVPSMVFYVVFAGINLNSVMRLLAKEH